MGGVQGGLERANKVLIPALFIMLVIMAIRGLMLPNGIEGVKWVFTPDFSKLNGSVAMAALNQCFFLAGVGMASLFSFGSYLDRENSDIPFSATVIIFSNIVVAMLAGTAIFSSLFSYGMDVAGGSGLVFMTLPYVFHEMTGGIIWGTMFFVLLFAAGLSTILGLYEGAASVVGDAFGWDRKKAIIVVTIIMFILSIPTIFSTTALKNVTPLGMDLFTFFDFFAMLITLPIGALTLSVYVGTKFWDRYLEHSAVGAKYFKVPGFTAFKYWYIIVCPVITISVVVYGIMGYF